MDVPYCREPYDDDHIRLHGYNCVNRHKLYSWPSLSKEKYLLLGDSLLKFINRAKHLRVIAIPGARAHDMLRRVCATQIRIEGYSLIICAIGTNDAADPTMPCKLAAQGISMLMATISSINPDAMVMFSGLLIRPKDIGTHIEYRRMLINKIVTDMCKSKGIRIIKSWRCLMTRSNVRDRVYARDGLHLNRMGARHLYKCLEGNITNVEGKLKQI